MNEGQVRGPVTVDAVGLAKTYRGPRGQRTEAVRDVTFSCRRGEVYGLLGPNGAGKTTTLRMLSTVLAPSAGHARIAGHDVATEASAVRSRIGFLSGHTGLPPRLTPREVLAFFGRLHGLSDELIATTTEHLAATFGMRDFLDQRCDALSSGMKQKVNVARTVLHDPDVLILDEPTVGLDVLASRTIVDFVRDCRARGKCVLFSTHIMGEVSRLCDRLAIVHRGRVQFEGTLEDLRLRAGADLEEAFVTILEQST